jgi:hypothetical protein
MSAADVLEVVEAGTLLRFGYADLLRYHGPGFLGGVAHGFKVLSRALPLLARGAPPERRAIRVETAFPGPGARDAIEMVTRAVSDGRYDLDLALPGPPAPEAARGRYLFRLHHFGTTVTLVLRPGQMQQAYMDLSRKPMRSAAEEAELEALKAEMAARLNASPAAQVYHAEVTRG